MTLITDTSLWGVQPTGFYAPNVEEILAVINQDLHDVVSPDLDLDPDSPDGQRSGVVARQLALVWAGLKVVHDANNPDNAEGELLDDLLALTGVTREGPRPTVVTALCTLTAGTTLLAGVSMASVVNRPDQTYTPIADFTALADGSYSIPFQATETGPQQLTLYTLTVVQTGETGWTDVINNAPAAVGSDGMTDAEARLFREQELTRAGSATAAALVADISVLDGVASCAVLENDTDTTDLYGVEPHSFEVLVYGAPDTATLAQKIWENKPAGIPANGTTEISYTDAGGTLRTVSYTPIAASAIKIWIELVTTDEYVGDETFADNLCALLTAEATAGSKVYLSHVTAFALRETGVVDVLSTAISLTGTPTYSNLTIDPRHIATFNPADVTLV